MAFQDEYSKTVTRETTVESNKNSTILPFFGFELQSDSESYVDSYGGNTYISKVEEDTYKVSKSQTNLYYRTKYYLKWRRKKPILTDYELETEVQGWLKKNKFDDIWTTPYICPSANDFHQKYGYSPKNKLFRGIIISILIIGALLSVVLALTGGSIFSTLPDFLQDLKLQLSIIPFILSAEVAVVLLFFKYLHNKKYRAKPLSNCDQKYQDTLRQQYYNGLVNVFGEDLGNKMKNLSIQREEAQK